MSESHREGEMEREKQRGREGVTRDRERRRGETDPVHTHSTHSFIRAALTACRAGGDSDQALGFSDIVGSIERSPKFFPPTLRHSAIKIKSRSVAMNFFLAML